MFCLFTASFEQGWDVCFKGNNGLSPIEILKWSCQISGRWFCALDVLKGFESSFPVRSNCCELGDTGIKQRKTWCADCKHTSCTCSVGTLGETKVAFYLETWTFPNCLRLAATKIIVDLLIATT